MAMMPRAKKPEAATPAAEANKPAAQAAAAAASPAAATTAGPAASPDATAAGESTSTAVAMTAPKAVVARVPVGKQANVLVEDFKNAFKLDWNTLHRLQANNGNILDLENNKKSLGTEVEIELMTFQDNFQISPGSNEPGASEIVRYSDDGLTTTNGEDCKEWIAQALENGWEKTKMTPRVTLAGTLTKCNDPAMVGKIVQIDLSQTSKSMFDRHCFQAAIDVSRGLRTRESCSLLKLTCTMQSAQKQGQTMSWTMVQFGYGTPAA